MTQVKVILQAHALTPVSNRLVISSSPIVNPVDAPAPQVTVATRTSLAGASFNTCRSLAEASVPLQRSTTAGG